MSAKTRSPEWWMEQIEDGLEYRRKFGLEDKWGEFEAMYYNVSESMANDGPNLFMSQGDALLATVGVPSPAIRVRATKPEEVGKAPIVETLDNTLLRDLELSTEVDTACLNAYLFGRGFLKLGYDSEWGYDPEYDVGGQLQLGLTLTQLNAQGTKRIEYDSTVTPGSPWARSVLPHDIVVPWGTKELDSAPWIAHRLVRHIDDLRADRKYSNTQRLQPQVSMQDFMDSYRFLQRKRGAMGKMNSREVEFVEIYEIHDRQTGKIYVVSWDHPSFLRNDDNALQIDNKLPFTSLAFTPRSRAFWTTPDVYYLYHIQNEISDVAVQRTKQRRISTMKFLYDGDSISEEELQKMLSPDVGVAAKVESGRDISKAIQKLDNQPNMMLAQEEELLRANAREQIGFSRNQLGEYTPGRKTAREVATVDRSSQLRMSRRGLLVKRLYEDTIRIINGIVFSYWTLPRYVSVIGPQKTEQWMAINGPSLKGRYDYNVEFVEEGELRARKMEALQLWGMLSQDPNVDPQELRDFLTSEFNDPNFERLFNANIRGPVSGMPGQGGDLPTQLGGGSGGGVSGMRPGNGAARQQVQNRLMASGRAGT